ncbi:MAG TPA: GNAT family N-acetyltransferase, partial [Chitinophagaceae bacterium]|nr:GNAT family N-acetyltransferase [Chitinophagaceae bacterium]
RSGLHGLSKDWNTQKPLPPTNMEIIDYEARYHEDFRKLNLEWLEKYGLAESHDLMVLDDPQGTIIDRGGCIFLAREDGIIIGTAALMKEHEGVYELAKMSVAPAFRGRGISKLLLAKCLEEARHRAAKKILLFSNHQLTTALALYTSFGFRNIPVAGSPFVTADVKMELVLTA